MRCPKCGFENRDGANFCKKCGYKFTGKENKNFAQTGKSQGSSIQKKSNKKAIVIITVVTLVIVGVMVGLYLLFCNNSIFEDKEKKSSHKKDNSISSKMDDTTSGFNTDDLTDETETSETSTVTETTTQYTTSASSTITVPDVVGLMYSDAYTKMKDLNIDYNVCYQYSDVAYNYVISQNPAAGKTISPGDKMTVYVSKGKDNYNNPNYSSSRSSTSYSGEYILYDSNSRIISENEVYYMDKTKMELALNEIYARHGRIFNTKYISDYFNSKSWYHGTVSPDNFNERVFNYYEKSNRDMLVKVMKKKGYR